MSLVHSAIEEGERKVARLRILVVDDNDDVADCLAMLLQSLGHLPRACCSGRDCLACLYEFRPDVILLDLSMPAQDGFEICRLIRQTPGFEAVPIIACSALDPYSVCERADGCEFSHYLVKPVSSRQLQAAIEEAVAEETAELAAH
jgi:CheY-like chemotaxis protein